MEVIEVSTSGECKVVKLTSKEWKRCNLHFETEQLEIYSRNMNIQELYGNATSVHSFRFPSAFNRFLIPRDAVIRSKNDDVLLTVKRALSSRRDKGKITPSDTGYVTKDAVECGDVNIVAEEDDDVVEEEVDDVDPDVDDESILDEEDDEVDDDVGDGELIVDDEWYGGSVGNA